MLGRIDITRAIPIDTAAEFDTWIRSNPEETEVNVAIFKKTSGKQTVTFDQLLEVALCHGWIDTQGKRIDDERWALRFVPRRSDSNWSARNRATARRLIAEGRMTPAGHAALPADLEVGS